MISNKVLFISKSTQNLTAWLKTIFLCFLPVLGVGLWGFKTDIFPLSVLLFGVDILCFGTVVWGFLYGPYCYVITETSLVIKRHLGNIIIPIQQIHTIRLFNTSDKDRLYRFDFLKSWRVDGIFGYFGVFKTESEKYHVITRRTNNWTLIVTDRKKYIIAPNNLKLIEVVQNQMNKLNLSGTLKKDEQKSVSTYPKRVLFKIITFIILAGTTFFLYLGYREPKITVSPVNFKVQYPWGITVPITEIASVDTVSWKEMPPITLRTNGISLFGVNRGSFKTKEGEKIRLNVKCDVSPVIRIVDRDSKTYYVNRKNPKETQYIFISLTTHLKTEEE